MAEPQWTNPHSLSCQEVCSGCVTSAPAKMTRGQLTGHLPVVTPPRVERYVFLGPGCKMEKPFLWMPGNRGSGLDPQAPRQGTKSLTFRMLSLLQELSGLMPRKLDKSGLFSQQIQPAKQEGLSERVGRTCLLVWGSAYFSRDRCNFPIRRITVS